MQQDFETKDQEIQSLVQLARVELDKIEDQSKIEKREIVQQLAKDLEGKIATNTIAIEIVTELRDKVSERFIRECLDEKYKEPHRIKNAKKQKKDLAALPPLNCDSNQEKQKVLIDNAGNTINEPPSSLTEATDNTNCANPVCRQLADKVHEMEEALKKAAPATRADKITKENNTTTPGGSEDDFVDFEFSLQSEQVQNYMSERSKSGRSLKVSFNGTLDRRTGKIIAAGIGGRNERAVTKGLESNK